MRRHRLLIAFGLWLAVIGSGAQVAFVTHEVRETHVELQALLRDQDRLLAEHSRLLLERGALAAYQNVERVAEAELSMHFPTDVERIPR
ncbi:MAG: cell division protein FtsL [Gammaproteobacteria bacterium]|nr:cell division protein FtsL [Gammaproteobacteria bacterium]